MIVYEFSFQVKKRTNIIKKWWLSKDLSNCCRTSVGEGCLGAEVGIFKWKVEFHGMEWNLMERFHVELIKTSQNSNGEIPQV